ncbi:MAG: Rid family detoxifying hydrolase [Desulfurococcaceae archaeon TW002]
MKYIYTEKAPKPIGPYSQGVLVGNFLFISGQLPINPLTGELIKNNFREATRQALTNVIEIVRASGGDTKNIVKATVYLKDISKFSEFNEVYSELLGGHKPARAVVAVSSIPRDADLMIEAVAYLEST